VAALSNAAGELVETYEYDVYGDTTVKDTAGTILTKSSIGNPYGFTGRRVDVETGLYYYRARYYDVDTGRFLQTDPIGSRRGNNLYRYCDNNPIIWIDPLGLSKDNSDKPWWEIIDDILMPGAQAEDSNDPTPEEPTKKDDKEKIPLWKRIRDGTKAALDAAQPGGIPAISAVETAGEMAKTAPKVKSELQDRYDTWGNETGQWGKSNPYYDSMGVHTKDGKPYRDRLN